MVIVILIENWNVLIIIFILIILMFDNILSSIFNIYILYIVLNIPM